nr:IS1634 family transposase [Actinomyces naeslundii]
MGVLLEALETDWKAVGLDGLNGADEVFRQLVTARLIEPTSKQDSLRVLAEAGLSPVSYATVKRHLPSYATEGFTRDLSRLLAGYARIGRAWLVLFDVTALYFETDKADGFREPGLSKERRLEPQITVGLLTDETGFPLRAGAFEGNKAETATTIPMINDFMDVYSLDDVVLAANAGMISATRARHTLRGIDTQVAKAEKAVAGKIPVKRNRFVHLSGATRNRDLEKRARTLAGWKGYVTNRGPLDHRHRRPGHGPSAGDHHRLVHQTPDQHRIPGRVSPCRRYPLYSAQSTIWRQASATRLAPASPDTPTPRKPGI